MKLWILRPNEELKGTGEGNNPWDPWFDKAFGFVVRAETEAEARIFADTEAGDENHDSGKHPWLDYKYSICSPLSEDGEAGVILKDFASA